MPFWFSIHCAPGPQGDGLHGSGFEIHLCHCTSHTKPELQFESTKHSTQPSMESGIGTNPGLHLKEFHVKNQLLSFAFLAFVFHNVN